MHKSPALLALLVFCATPLGLRGAGSVELVKESRPTAVIVVPNHCDERTRAAAETFSNYVQRASQAKLNIVDEAAPVTDASLARVHVGADGFVQALKLGLERLDGDGFVIRGVDAHNLVIAGPTAWGTEFGVVEFLERYLGVRWLMPGPEGEDVPRLPSVAIPLEEVRQEPAFFSRTMSGFHASQLLWAERNRMHDRLKFHHNLHSIFPSATYGTTHPEYYPVQKGQRHVPPTTGIQAQVHWQPCFSAPGLAEEAIKHICAYFAQNPEATSFSLGVNDSGGHCECPACAAKDPPTPNFINKRNVSDAYYAWCNEVVAGVLKKYPDKYFGCLAYSEVAQPPTKVKLHERLIPFMTYDRMKWALPELRTEGEKITREWAGRCSTLGWYDYIYGAAYCLPRVWFHQMADYLRTGQDLGVKALYAEAYPCWGEGPKLYVAFKLQWNPRQDVDALLQDWYVRAVGREAAADLAAYYAHWEDFWTRRVFSSKWFTKNGQYLSFHTPSYLTEVTEDDLRQSRRWMEQVVAKAGTPEQKARANILMLAYRYYEASAIGYRGKQPVDVLSLRMETDAMNRLEESRRILEAASERQQILTNDFQKIPALRHGLKFDKHPKLRSDDWGGNRLWTVFDWAQKSPAVKKRLSDLAASPTSAARPQAQAMCQLLDGGLTVCSRNSSFEETQGSWPKEWSNWITDRAGQGKLSPAAAYSGKQGLVYTGIKRGGPHQAVPVTPGFYSATAMVRIPKPIAGKATVGLKIVPMDEQNRNLPDISTTMDAAQCDWTRLAVAGEIRADYAGKPAKKARLIIILDSFGPEESIEIDDVTLNRLGKP